MMQENLTILVLSEKENKKIRKISTKAKVLKFLKFTLCFIGSLLGMIATFHGADSIFFAVFFVLYFLAFDILN